MTDKFTSPIFGETRHASEEEKAAIQKAIDETPVAVFGALNKHFNSLGMMISIKELPPQQH